MVGVLVIVGVSVAVAVGVEELVDVGWEVPGPGNGTPATMNVAGDHATCPQRIVTLYRNQYGVEAINLFP